MGVLHGVYVFGSVARGDRDLRSDLDLLAVVADGHGKVEEQQVYAHVPSELSELEPSISWYGARRLGEMFANGELFGWHLYQEAVPLFERRPIIAMLGKPSPYEDAVADVASFEKVLSRIPDQLDASPENSFYELGLVYVCLRNICMAASSKLCDRPDFSRYSPFRLTGIPPVPLSHDEYDLAMSCRMAGQRGFAPPAPFGPSLVGNIYARLAPWIAEIREKLESK
ncbi:nucleotidyltransferase domain-containing protein [Sphingopyxis sp. Root1497]|uniref:nucleotidyltransferase domain-containing protein n=1 Tax=Sphingopyxis sp. Root1497 TaxID=1736474 RepID=UPI000A8EE627|nr:nucleotidyltransferase domain-containing protein [Sphingopyxis sp. Root1497]